MTGGALCLTLALSMSGGAAHALRPPAIAMAAADGEAMNARALLVLRRNLRESATWDGAPIADLVAKGPCGSTLITTKGRTAIDWSDVGNIAAETIDGNHLFAVKASGRIGRLSVKSGDTADRIAMGMGLLAENCQAGRGGHRAGLRLSGPASTDAIKAVEDEAARQKMTQIRVDPTQSFAVIDGNQTVATLVTGEGSMPDAKRNGCFVAMKQGVETMLIPTLGYGEYEFETCGGPLAVGFVSMAAMPKLGIVFRSYSHEAEETVPIVVEWDRSNNTLLIDDAASRRALDARATSIAQICQALNGR